MIQYFLTNKIDIFRLILDHTFMVFVAVGLAFLIGLPLGILLARRRILGEVSIYFTSIFFCIPSIALFGFLMPILSHFGSGIGKVPAIIAVTIYSLAPIIRNTYSGILSIPPDVKEAAQAMGMNPWKRLIGVELPICIPNLIAGVKIAMIVGIATVSIGAYIGAGGLGLLIIRGISQSDYIQISLGAILVTGLALLVDYLMIFIEWLCKKIIFLIRKF